MDCSMNWAKRQTITKTCEWKWCHWFILNLRQLTIIYVEYLFNTNKSMILNIEHEKMLHFCLWMCMRESLDEINHQKIVSFFFWRIDSDKAQCDFCIDCLKYRKRCCISINYKRNVAIFVDSLQFVAQWNAQTKYLHSGKFLIDFAFNTGNHIWTSSMCLYAWDDATFLMERHFGRCRMKCIDLSLFSVTYSKSKAADIYRSWNGISIMSPNGVHEANVFTLLASL